VPRPIAGDREHGGRAPDRHGQDPRAVVVLDDDPTGTQTVYDLSVYTRWDVGTLAGALGSAGMGFYLLTNSRSMPESDAVALNRAIAANLRAASAHTGRPFTIISRSDSTLRGHFPAETDALIGPDESPPQIVLAPFFAEDFLAPPFLAPPWPPLRLATLDAGVPPARASDAPLAPHATPCPPARAATALTLRPGVPSDRA